LTHETAGELYSRVQHMNARYAHGIDDGDVDEVEACFLSDGVLRIAGVDAQAGGRAIAERLTGRAAPGILHTVTGLVVTPNGDGSYAVTGLFFMVDTATGQLTALGSYADVVVERDGRLAFSVRDVTYLWHAPAAPQTLPTDGAKGRMMLDAESMLTTTRAVRKRLDLDRPVPRELVEECVGIASQAPSGGNRRAFRFVLVDDPGRRQQLAEIYWRAFEIYRAGQTVATKAFEGDSARTAVQNRVFDSVEYLAQHLGEVPVLVVPVMAGRSEERTTSRSQAALWGSSIPAVWSFMLAARLRGLGTAMTTMHLEFEREAAEVLNVPYEQYTQLGLLPLAYTLGDDFRAAEREPASFFLRWNDFAQDDGSAG